MHWRDIPWRPTDRLLRQFAGLWLLGLGGLACYRGFLAGDPVVGGILAALAGTIGPLGLVWPSAVRPVFVAWMVLVFPIGWTSSRLLLAMVFYGLFTPLGLVLRWTGRDVLLRRFRPDQASYWIPRPAAGDVSRYFRAY
jgi:hypothetical protein